MSELAGWAGVGVLAAVGALCRFAFDGAITHRTRSPLPIGTIAVNTSGSLALGVLAGTGVAGWPLRLAGAALLGSYTTFSTWMLESGRLAAEADLRGSAVNLLGSLLLGLVAVALGWSIGGLL